MQYLRATAAFCVVLFHASYYLKALGLGEHFLPLSAEALATLAYSLSLDYRAF